MTTVWKIEVASERELYLLFQKRIILLTVTGLNYKCSLPKRGIKIEDDFSLGLEVFNTKNSVPLILSLFL
jgi:hypothetical protein